MHYGDSIAISNNFHITDYSQGISLTLWDLQPQGHGHVIECIIKLVCVFVDVYLPIDTII